MTPEQLDIVVARTRHEHFRVLTAEGNPNVAQRDKYRRYVERAASNQPHPAPATPAVPRRAATMAELRDASKRGSSRCWLSEKDSACGCSGLMCHLLGRRIDIYDCVECLKRW